MTAADVSGSVPDDAVEAGVTAVIQHQRIPTYNEDGNRCSGCGHLHDEADGPNSPRVVEHQVRIALAAAAPHLTAQVVSAEDVPLASERLGLALVRAVVDSDWLAEHDQRVRERIATAIAALREAHRHEPNEPCDYDEPLRIARAGGTE